MKIKPGQIISEAKGKIAGAVFVRSSEGSYMRQKVSPINPQTQSQQSNRILHATVTQSWRNLTENARNAWNTVAPSFNHTNAFGDNVPLSGFGLYTRINRNRQEILKALIKFPPSPASIIGLTSLNLIFSPIFQDLELFFTPNIPLDQVLLIYASPPLSPGISNAGFKYRRIGFLNIGAISPQSIKTKYIATFNTFIKPGQKIFVKAKPVHNLSGLDGTIIITSESI